MAMIVLKGLNEKSLRWPKYPTSRTYSYPVSLFYDVFLPSVLLNRNYFRSSGFFFLVHTCMQNWTHEANGLQERPVCCKFMTRPYLLKNGKRSEIMGLNGKISWVQLAISSTRCTGWVPITVKHMCGEFYSNNWMNLQRNTYSSVDFWIKA